MILNAVFVNLGGGKVLLDTLIQEFKSKQLNVFNLLDDRLDKEYDFIDPKKRISFPVRFLKDINFCFFSRIRGPYQAQVTFQVHDIKLFPGFLAT